MIYVQLSEITCIESLIIRGCIILVFSTNFVLFCLLQSLGKALNDMTYTFNLSSQSYSVGISE